MADAAGRIWARAGGDTATPEKVAAAAERIGTQLRAGLGRWIGAAGYRALLERSLGVARAKHPALRGLSFQGDDKSAIIAAVAEHGAGRVGAGMVALLAVLIELLGVIIGDDMALRLVEQIGAPSEHGAAKTKAQGRHDG